MNHGPAMHSQGMPHSQYADSHHHPSSHVPHSSVSSAASAPSYYSSYAAHQGMPNGLPTYAPPMPISSYGSYVNGMNPMTPVSSGGSMGLHQSSAPLPTLAANSSQSPAVSSSQENRPADLTGQVAPNGAKPRVTATLWEDEGTLCFQVEAGGICVARREDNHMINGTKLLNVAGMTRGRRDGILKSEKTRHVVKIGPMHLKGVWIPFERALEFANKEKITEQLYPLFVHQISQLLYHPPGATRASITSTAMATTDRSRTDPEGDYMRTSQSSQAPSLQHHHTMSGSISAQGPQSGHPAASHSSARPGLDRAHTFAAPSSGGGVMGMADSSGYSGHWQGSAVPSGSMSQGLHIDTGINGARSVPSTPANPVSSPPTNGMAPMSSYPTTGPYEAGRAYHSAHPSYSSSYGGMNRFGQHLQSSPSGKTSDMGPPARVGHDDDHKYSSQAHDHTSSSEVGENDHDHEYTHSAGPYAQHRNSYAYSGQNQTPGGAESQGLSGSPHKPSGRATPRTAANYSSYNTSQRPSSLPASNLYNVMGDARNLPNGSEMYSTGYSSQTYASPTGLPPSNKRAYEHDEDESNGIKRQRTILDDSSRPMISQKKR
ncbi:hypothetical protein CAC42_4504 [Sphaceloma murrayae]|uniref:HTH APSES-type domain-containing protein n=1 Tax=Sphaceloma murrayae TaxID=2082308 RepID=A0A2K1QMN8_9PEZI|nr:hypothetical protein CAC42_4504 [Sphaceloma murrayae]